MNILKTLYAYLKLIRIGNLLMIALSLCLFYYMILVPVHEDKLQTSLVPFAGINFLLFVLSVVMVAAAGNVINDYLDFEADKEYKPDRPLAKGEISLNTAVYLHGMLALGGVAIGFYLGWATDHFKIGYLYVICVLLLYLYSSFLKKIPLVGNIVVAALTGFIFVLLMFFEADFLRRSSYEAADYAFSVIILQVKFYAGLAFIISLAREIVKDLEDREGDAAHNINTLPVKFGERAGKMAGVVVLVILLGGLSVVMSGFAQIKAFKELSYLLFAVAIPVVIVIAWLFFAADNKQYKKISLALKIIMLMGILSMPAFYLFGRMG